MVYLSRIYTRAGDAGTTQLGDGSTLPKHHLRVAAYGNLDEVSSVLGLALVHGLEGTAAARLAQSDDFIVVIDPGHGGIDPGALRSCIKEADLMLVMGT